MFYREAGDFKTSYVKDQQIFGIALDRWAFRVLLVFAFFVVPFFRWLKVLVSYR